MRDSPRRPPFKSGWLLTPLSITATPIPAPVYPDCHAANAFTAGAALLKLGLSVRSRLMYFTLLWFESGRMFSSGSSATIPFTRGSELRIDPSSERSCRSRRLGGLLYCTTTRALEAVDFCRSGDSFEVSAAALAVNAPSRIRITNLFTESPSLFWLQCAIAHPKYLS